MQKDPAEAKPLSRSEKKPSRQRTKPQKPNAIEPAASQTPPQKQQTVRDRRTKRKRHISRQSCASIPSRNRYAFEVTPPGKARQWCRATSKTAQLHLHSNAPLKPESKRSSTTRCVTRTDVSIVRQNQTRQPIERLQGRAIPQRRTARNNSAFTEHGLSTTA